jgi:hypothetical protein
LLDLVEGALDDLNITISTRQRIALRSHLIDLARINHVTVTTPGHTPLPTPLEARPRHRAESVRNESRGETPEAS